MFKFILIIIMTCSIFCQEQIKFEQLYWVNGSIRNMISPDSKRIFVFTNTNPVNLYRSDDAGMNWSQIWTDDVIYGKDSKGNDSLIYKTELFSGFSCPDTGFCIAFSNDYIRTTYDGGFSWSFRNSNLINNIFIFKMFNRNKGAGISYTDKKLCLTSDRGNNWRFINGDTIGLGYAFFQDINIIEDNNLFLLSSINLDSCDFYKSNDFGKSWQKKQIQNYSNNIYFTDSLNGWMTAFDKRVYMHTLERIYKTSDAGASWNLQLDSIYPDILTFSAKDSLNAIAATYHNIMITTNGGKIWNSYKWQISASGLQIVYLVDNNWLVADAGGNKIYKLTLETVDIKENSNQKENLSLYPNPSKDYIYLNEKIEGKIEIFSIEGIKVYETTVINQLFDGLTKINISSLQTGYYILKTYKKTFNFIKL